MADSVSLIFQGIPLLDELIDFDKVCKPDVEFIDTVVGLALLRKVVHVLFSVGVSCYDGTQNEKGGNAFHVTKIFIINQYNLCS